MLNTRWFVVMRGGTPVCVASSEQGAVDWIAGQHQADLPRQWAKIESDEQTFRGQWEWGMKLTIHRVDQ